MSCTERSREITRKLGGVRLVEVGDILIQVADTFPAFGGPLNNTCRDITNVALKYTLAPFCPTMDTIRDLDALLHLMHSKLSAALPSALCADIIGYFLSNIAFLFADAFAFGDEIPLPVVDAAFNIVEACSAIDGAIFRDFMAAYVGLHRHPPFLTSASNASIMRHLLEFIKMSPHGAVNVIKDAIPDRAVGVCLAAFEHIAEGGLCGVEVLPFLEKFEHTYPTALWRVDVPRLVDLLSEQFQTVTMSELLAKYYALCRMNAIDVMETAWKTHGGHPPAAPPAAPAGRRLAALKCTLPLRRFCRVRGPNSEGMPHEVVEPFARDIVRFL
jgi:hypothetical protein